VSWSTGAHSGIIERAFARPSADSARDVLAHVLDRLGDAPVDPARATGYRLLRVGLGTSAWYDVDGEGDGHAIVGSHERCDVTLPVGPDVALRHLLVTCAPAPAPEGATTKPVLGLRILDLKTSLPFFLDNEEPLYSAIVSGAFSLRVGVHVICGFPLGSVRPAMTPLVLPDALVALQPPAEAPPRPANDDLAPHTLSNDSVVIPRQSDDRPIAHSPYRDAKSWRSPTVTPCRPITQIQDLVGVVRDESRVRVTLERSGMGASLELPVSALETGVLLGRAQNCLDGGLRRVLCESISRAHVLLLKRGDGFFAFDLATTNGTRVEGKRVRSIELLSTGVTIEMAKKVTLRWHSRG
jgi:hypothetical protein